jgi:hypothetical protein
VASCRSVVNLPTFIRQKEKVSLLLWCLLLRLLSEFISLSAT